MVIIEGGRLECQDDALDLGSEDDMVIITGGTLIGDEDGITCGEGDDKVVVSNAHIESTGLSDDEGDVSGENAIEGDEGNDTVTIGSNVRIEDGSNPRLISQTIPRSTSAKLWNSSMTTALTSSNWKCCLSSSRLSNISATTTNTRASGLIRRFPVTNPTSVGSNPHSTARVCISVNF